MVTLLLLLGAIPIVWYVWERRQRKTRAMPGGIHEHITLPYAEEWELYHNAFSLCSKKTRVCLAELGLPYKSHHIDLIETGAYENISRHFLQVNPAALVPVLVHNGHPIYESHEQLSYAAQHASRPVALVPENEAQRNVMEYWVHKSSLVGDDPLASIDETAGNAVPGLTIPIFAAMIEHIPVSRIVEGLLFHRLKKRALFFLLLKFRGVRRLPRLKPIMKILRSSRAAMHTHLDELENALDQSGGPWIVGEQFTLADVGMMVILERLREVDWLDEFLGERRPHVSRYWEALQARPSYQAGVSAFTHSTVTRGAEKIVALKQTDPAFREALVGAL